MSYTITLATGEKLTNLGLNGNNFISKKKVDESIFFNEAMSEITISDGEKTETHKNWVFIQQQKWFDGTYYICLGPQDSTVAKFLEIEEAIADVYEAFLGGN